MSENITDRPTQILNLYQGFPTKTQGKGKRSEYI